MTGAPITIDDAGPFPSDHALLERAARAARELMGRPDLEVAIRVTADAEIGELHGRFLGDPSPTDVMSFDLDDSADVVVNAEQAAREAAADGHDVAAELALYVVHGVLHVCGHDDHDPVARMAMRAAERRVMAQLGLAYRAVD